MSETPLNGLMMDDYPLSLTAAVERAERYHDQRAVAFPTARWQRRPHDDG